MADWTDDNEPDDQPARKPEPGRILCVVRVLEQGPKGGRSYARWAIRYRQSGGAYCETQLYADRDDAYRDAAKALTRGRK